MADFTNITGALGSIIGYLGAEVAGEVIFERLLWPQRFYNDFSFAIALKMAIFMPMGGPLHRAALKTLDTFQNNGLYRGRQLGVMLGTAFYQDLGVSYFARTIEKQKDVKKEGRNGFWIAVARRLVHGRPSKRKDAENTTADVASSGPKRASIPLHCIVLEKKDRELLTPKDVLEVSEDGLAWQCWLGVLFSELTAIAAALVAGVYLRCTWVAIYFCFPLLLKVFSLLIKVDRETVAEHKVDESEAVEMFEIDDLTHGMALIGGPEHLLRQFFRHYGHPRRQSTTDGRSDRVRESLCITLIYLFVLYFPVGLIALLWMPSNVQYLWLGYQLYTVIAMHIARLAGLNGCGRTEERIAKQFEQNGQIVLQSRKGPSVAAWVETTWYDSVAESKKATKSMLQSRRAERLEATVGIGDHNATLKPVEVERTISSSLSTSETLLEAKANEDSPERKDT